MKDRKSAVLAAIDDNWRLFRSSLERLVSDDMSKPDVHKNMSVTDLVGHITTQEWKLVTALDYGNIETTRDDDDFNDASRKRKNSVEPRQAIADMEQVHRSLRDGLARAPSAYFEPFDPFRALIDASTVLHYQEHGMAIRIWATKNSMASPRR